MMGGAMAYFPPRDDWAKADPAELGLDPDRLAAAVAFAEAHDSAWPRSLTTERGEFYATAVYVPEPPPYNEVVGPIRPRGGPSGLVVRAGRLAAEWGDTGRADMTFSVTKSYLALLAGLAVADGRIRDLDAPVRESALDDGFESAHNRAVTWRHLLQQTSEWEGTVWGKPDTVDRNRVVGAGATDNAAKGAARALRSPGTHFEYNDVRVNRLSRALMQVFRRPLPEVLRERIMERIGASDGWEWPGYRTSWEEIDGRRMQGVPGGGHWGGGLMIGARDHARVGVLVLREGTWAGRAVLPATWIAELTRPSAGNPAYGLLWWLNTGRRLYPSAPAGSVFALGGGTHVIWVDRERDLVVVARWIDKPAVDGLLARILAAVAG
jgi:CubicO group peptidase (beta-lactamase class C family)